MMKTGIVCRKVRVVGSGQNARVVEEYEIDTAAVEALNSIERRAAIETGQEQEKLNLNGQISKAGIDEAKVFTLEELEEMERRYNAKFEEERQAKAQAKLLAAGGEMNTLCGMIEHNVIPPALSGRQRLSAGLLPYCPCPPRTWRRP